MSEHDYQGLSPAEAWARVCKQSGVRARTEKVGSAFDWTDFAMLCESAIGLALHERAAAAQRAAQAEHDAKQAHGVAQALERQLYEARADAARARGLLGLCKALLRTHWLARVPVSGNDEAHRMAVRAADAFLSTPCSGAALLRELEGLRKVRETAAALDTIYGPVPHYWGVSGALGKNAWEALRAALRATQPGGGT